MKPIAICVAAALAATVAPALGDDLPTRKPGLWETTTITTGGQITARQCVDAGSDTLAYSAMRSQSCTDNRLHQTADGYLAEAKCRKDTFNAEGRVVITGDFQTTVRAESSTVMTGLPGSSAPMTVRTVVESRYLGECEPGTVPGDLILQNGKIVHVPPIKR